MNRSSWEKLGDELLSLDRWGDFYPRKIKAATTDRRSWIWDHVHQHPVSIMVNGAIPLDHFEVYAPVLLRALDELTVESGLEMVVRALSRKGLTGATGKLVSFFTDDALVHEQKFLWAVGNAICAIAPRDHVDQCIAICQDRRLGSSRHQVIIHLSRFKKSEEVFQTLLSLLDDESVRAPVLEALKRYGDVRAISAIERTPVKDGDEGTYERHQKMTGLNKLNEKKKKARG